MLETTLLQNTNLLDVLPFIVSLGLCMLIILVEAFLQNERITRLTAMASLAALIASIIYFTTDSISTVQPAMITFHPLSKLSCVAVLFSGIFSISLPSNYLSRHGMFTGEYYVVLFISLVGMMMMLSATHFIMLFIGIETMSISLYILSGFATHKYVSNEASFKYFILGAFSTGFLIYGIALIYGATGALYYYDIEKFLTIHGASPLFYSGFSLLLVGLLFKISAVPFHQWTPDVYEGSPAVSTAFIASVSKGAAYLTVASISLSFYLPLLTSEKVRLAIIIVSALSMITGAAAALVQTSIKRIVAYSSIAHTGYFLIGIITSPATPSASTVYAIIYIFSSLGLLSIIASLEEKEGTLTLSDLKGLYLSSPTLALLMVFFTLNLAGIPPTAGFFAKYFIFIDAIGKDEIVLTLIGVITSAVSLIYYLRLIYPMFQRPPKKITYPSEKLQNVPLVLLAFFVLLIGLFPSYIFRAAESAVSYFSF